MMQINAIISLKLYETYKFIVRLGNNSYFWNNLTIR